MTDTVLSRNFGLDIINDFGRGETHTDAHTHIHAQSAMMNDIMPTKHTFCHGVCVRGMIFIRKGWRQRRKREIFENEIKNQGSENNVFYFSFFDDKICGER
jgi:hypothetical protein